MTMREAEKLYKELPDSMKDIITTAIIDNNMEGKEAEEFFISTMELISNVKTEETE